MEVGQQGIRDSKLISRFDRELARGPATTSPRSFADDSSARIVVVPTTMTRPPLARASLIFRAVASEIS